MYILLVTKNSLISTLFHSIEERLGSIEEVSSLAHLSEKENIYDVIFIDETLCPHPLLPEFTAFSQSKKVLITSTDESLENVDAKLKKPFLSSQILDVVQTLTLDKEKRETVLDREEIEKIKSLLRLESSIDEVKIKDKKRKKQKSKVLVFPKIKKKDLKKLLKGKEIKIRIKLREEKI